MTSCMTMYGNFSAHQKATVGDTKMSAVGLDHMGWMLCDGRTLNVKDFYFLFSVIQYSFGGSGAQFKLPNPAGRVAGVIGGTVSVSTSVHAMGEVLGEETHTLTVAEMPTHTHIITDPGHTHSVTALTGVNNNNYVVIQGDSPPNNSLTNGANSAAITTTSSTTGITINYTGASNAHNNMQPTLFMGNMFIYSGLVNLGTYPNTTGSYPYSTITAYTGLPNTIIL